MKTKDYPPTPELNKMKAIHDQSQKIGEFIEWLRSKGVHFGKPHTHDSSCPGWDEDRQKYNPTLDGERCSYQTDEFEGFNFTIEKLLAEFFEIDLATAEEERRAILEHLQT